MHDSRNAFTTNSQPAPHKRAPGSITNKSKVTNGRWVLDGVDMRSPAGRRFRDLCDAFEKEAGCNLTEVEKGLVRQAAALTLRSEQMQTLLVNGEPVDGDQLIRLTGTAKRILEAIGAKAAKRKPSNEPDLDEYLRSKADAA